MNKIYDLTKNGWISDFFYAYGPQAKNPKRVFTEADRDESGALIAGNYDEKIKDYDYISVMTRKKYTTGTIARAKCSYRGTGAPLIVLCDDIDYSTDVAPRYKLHYEAVAYSGGCNCWRVDPLPERVERPIRSTKIGFNQFAIAEDEPIDISVEVLSHALKITVNGEALFVEEKDIPESFHIGFTVCEGICKFWEFSVEN